MVMLDAIHYKVREDGIVVKKAVYIAIGTDLEGRKERFRTLGWCELELKILAGCS